MRKSTTYHYSEGDVKQIIKDELKLAKNDIIDQVSQNVTEGVTDSFTQKLTQFKDEIMTLLDKVMGELKAIREEQTVISSYKEQIENHETRIGKIKEVLEPNPTSA